MSGIFKFYHTKRDDIKGNQEIRERTRKIRKMEEYIERFRAGIKSKAARGDKNTG